MRNEILNSLQLILKMAGGSYNVEKLEGSTRKDTSFRSCVCALLVVLFICIIGLLVTAFIRGSHKEEKNVTGISSN